MYTTYTAYELDLVKDGSDDGSIPTPIHRNVASKITNAGKLNLAVRTDIINALVAAWTNYNTAGNVPVVYSRRLRATNNITHFNIGDIFDVQTRRDNKLITDRSTVSMP